MEEIVIEHLYGTDIKFGHIKEHIVYNNEIQHSTLLNYNS